MNRLKMAVGSVLLFGVTLAPAQTPGDAPPPATPDGGMGWVLVKTLLALGVVVGLVAAVTWIIKKLAVTGRTGGQAVHVVGTTYLAPKKSITLVDIGERRLVLGVTDQSIQLLTEMAKPEDEALPAAPGQPGFKHMLEGFLKGRGGHE